MAEEGAVEAAAEMVEAVGLGWQAARPATLSEARAVEKDTGREYMHAATRHCYYQRAELQLLLRQLRFCGAELNGGGPPNPHLTCPQRTLWGLL